MLERANPGSTPAWNKIAAGEFHQPDGAWGIPNVVALGTCSLGTPARHCILFHVCRSANRGAQLLGSLCLLLGTRLRVTDPTSGRSVIVIINDRGPFGRGRILDLSTSAAKVLGMTERGVILVKADVL